MTIYIPIDVAAVGTVGKNKNCPLFGSRSNWNGTGGGNTDSIGTWAEIFSEHWINEIYFKLKRKMKIKITKLYNKICWRCLNQLHPLLGIKSNGRYARLITQIADGDGILMRLFTKIISHETVRYTNCNDSNWHNITRALSKLMSNNNISSSSNNNPALWIV